MTIGENRSRRGLRLLAAGIAAPATLFAQGGLSEKRITARGQAAGTSQSAVDEACLDARRNAVLQGCGEVIGATSVVDNFELVRDQIISKANGYIVSAEEIQKGSDPANHISYCEVSAVVALGKIKDRPPMLWTSPRVIPFATEDLDTSDGLPPVLGGNSQIILEGELAEANLTIIDAATKNEILEKDKAAANLKGPAEALCALVKRHDADIIVQFDFTATPQGSVRLPEPVNQDIFRFSANLNVRVIQIDNARVIFSKSFRPDEFLKSFGPTLDPNEASRFVEKETPKIVRKIAEAIQQRSINFRDVSCTFTGVTADEFRTLKERITEIRGCQGVLTRQATGDYITADVRWAFSTDRLAEQLVVHSPKGFPLETEELTADSLKMKVKKD